MEPSFWETVWNEGRIGFHEGRPNELLAAHVEALGPKGRVLVPLCGKAYDLAFLAKRGHEVIGIELVETAVQAFFDEQGLEPTRSRRGTFEVYSAARITIFQGDFFAATPADIGPITAFYDRAALVALPPQMRSRYVAQLNALAGADRPGLMVTFEYPVGALEGPPFSVPEAELRSHFPEVTRLAERALDSPRFREAGLLLLERLYAVQGP